MSKGGHPTDYNKDIIPKCEEYLKESQDVEIKELVGLSKKGTELYKTRLKVKIPTVEGLALYLNVARHTLYNWEKVHEEFLHIMEKLRAKQAEALINNGLAGNYNPTISKVLLTKHGYREGIENTGKDGEKLIPESELSDEDKELLALMKSHGRDTTTETK